MWCSGTNCTVGGGQALRRQETGRAPAQSHVEVCARLAGRRSYERFTPHSSEISFNISHGEQRQQCEGHEVEQRGLRRLEHLGRHRRRQQAQEVAQQGTVEVRQPGTHRSGARNLSHLTDECSLLIRVVSQHKTQQ